MQSRSCTRPFKLLSVIFVTYFYSSICFANAIIVDPTFSNLSSDNGLSHNTVNTSLLDNDGFLWIGTKSGLNRYDGYQNVQIHGPNDEFLDAPIEYIYQDSQENLWVSEEISGVHKLNLRQNTIVNLTDPNNKHQPLPPASHIIEDSQKNIWLALGDRVVKFSLETGALSTVYVLPTNLQSQNVSITYLLLNDNFVFIATNQGLLGGVADQPQLSIIEYTDTVVSNQYNQHVKSLHVDDFSNLWIGTAEGLFNLDLNHTKKFVAGNAAHPKRNTRISKRNIWQIIEAKQGMLYLVTDEGLYNYYIKGEQLQFILRPTDNKADFVSNELRNIVIDSNENFWLGTNSDGAIYWSPQTTIFNNVHNTKQSEQSETFSNNNVTSLFFQDANHLWVGTTNGLNSYDISSGEIQNFMIAPDEKSQYSASSILQILDAPKNQLLLNTRSGVRLFDTKSHAPSALMFATPQDAAPFNQEIWSAITIDQKMWFVNPDGFFEYTFDTGKTTKLDVLSSTLDTHRAVTFLPGLSNRANTILLGLYGQLWEFNTHSGELILIHQTPLQHLKAKSYPDSVLIDSENVLWICYHGYGLVGLDADTYKQKFFYNNSNLLPTNSIYDMQEGPSGNIWIGSNTGLIEFHPNSHRIQKFNQAKGPARLDLNYTTSAVLNDEQMVFGSPKGLTFFNPKKLHTKEIENFDVTITGLSLSTKQLQLPLSNLDGQTVNLNYDDVGLKIQFSTLQFANQRNTRYRYQLEGESKVVYPSTSLSEVTFPTLKPGKYIFSVAAFNPESGIESKQAHINIIAQYALWASPWAYACYALIFLTCLGFLLNYRRLQNKRFKTAHLQAVSSKDRLSLALSASNSNIWEYQATADQFLMPRLAKELGHKSTANYLTYVSFIHRHDKVRYETTWQNFINKQTSDFDITYRMGSKSGEWFWFRDVGKIVKTSDNGEPVLVMGTYTNVTKHIVDKNNLRLFGEAFKHTHNWVIIYDHKCYPIVYNDSFKQSFGLGDQANVAFELKTLLKTQRSDTALFWKKMKMLEAGSHWKGKDKLIMPSGELCHIFVHVKAVASVSEKTNIEHFLVIISDITEQKNAEAKLLSLANYDALTGLPNRALLLDRIKHGLDTAERYQRSTAIFFIDLDKFKQVNDSLGHSAGDELLKSIATRLITKLRKQDTVARLGGDEFVIMIEDVTSVESIRMLVNEIIHIIGQPVTLKTQTVSVSSSIGISMYPSDGDNAEVLLSNADIAMYHAKEQGRSNFQFFTHEMNALVKNKLVLENKLKTAHHAKQFQNYYQPIVNVTTLQIEGFEILMRWPCEGGMIAPDKFIPLSEELGLIEHMTLDAFDRAMPVLKVMREKGFNGYLSVNLSARHFESQTSIDNIITLLEEHRIPVNAIRFEITEGALMRDYNKALSFMNRIKDKGFLIALDDFGTGYSSLKYLKEFPIDIIKIDKSFVDDIGKNQNNEAIILTTLSMAKQLNMSCIAEGIESAEQVAFFQLNGCCHLQGYYFSKPAPEDDLPELLQKTWSIIQ